MDEFLNGLNADRLAPWLMSGLVDRTLDEFARFVLVVIRLSGLMIIGPIFGQSTVPMNVRALLTVALALLITPVLPHHIERGFDRLDIDGNGLLVQDEIPGALRDRVPALQLASSTELMTQEEYIRLTRDDYRRALTPRLPRNVTDYAIVAAGELALGVLLGLGVMTILSGLQLAGQIVDQQAGFSLGEILNPDFDSTGSVSAQAMSYLGMTLFVILEPLGGHLTLLRLLIETFETLPLGAVVVGRSAIELIGGLTQQSLILAIRVAAPLMVMMTLIDLTLGFLGHSVPQINVQAVGYAVRASLCLLILVVLLSAIPEQISVFIPQLFDDLHTVIVQGRT